MAHRKSLTRAAKQRRIAHFLAQPLQAAAPGHSATLTGIQKADLEARTVGRVGFPWDADYDADRQETNPAFQYYPLVIVYCACETDVLVSMGVASDAGLAVSVRSGGHSTAGYSVNTGGMVIDLSEMKGVVLDEDRALVHVLPGTPFEVFNGALNGTGWHVPTGACGSVCVAGFVQGGGYGYTSRTFGIQSDKAAAFRVALASGTVVTANERENADLFWALRGGTGGNFGVVLQVSYHMVRLPSVWGWSITWQAEQAAQVLELLQKDYTRQGAPEQLGYMMNLGYYNGQVVYMVQGMYCGPRDEGYAAIEPLLQIPGAQLVVDKVGTYQELNNYFEDHPYPLPQDLPDGICETKASGYVDKPIPQAVWQKVIDQFHKAVNPWSMVYTEPYGGAIARYPVEGSAFVHRHVDMDIVIDGCWRDEGERVKVQAWIDGLYDLLRPYMNGHVYQNYPNRTLKDFANAYWGDATYRRLREVKTKYDPTNFFCYEQSIAPL